MVSNAAGQWTSRPVSAVCSGLTWTHREVTCEEDYMEVDASASRGHTVHHLNHDEVTTSGFASLVRST